MRRTVRASLGALEIAGSLCGVPFVGAAAIILKDIAQSCDDVRVQKRKARHITDKCASLLIALSDQSPALIGTELQARVDEVTVVFEKIQKRVRQWSRFSVVAQYIRSTEILEGLEQFDSELDHAMKLFQKFSLQMHAAIIMNNHSIEAQERQRSDAAEMRELLHQVLANRQGELRQVIEMQNAGEHVAETIMLDGQTELRNIRESVRERDGLMIATVRSTSPPPMRPPQSPPVPADSQRYLEYQRGLIQLHQLTGIPPSVKVLNGEVAKIGDLAVAGGTYSDIWLGTWLGAKKVALKALRNIKASDPKAQKRFEHEINVWADLKNDHILPFYGIVTDQGQHIQMVSPWQDNGNVLDYVKKFPDANRIHLLSGAAKGLEYLHSRNVIHGNVKCANILVSATGEACICDFGMSKVIEEVTEKSASATLTASGSARWLAPELIEGVVSSPTMEADTYSYAMAILELITGKHPFSNRRRDASVIHDIVVLKKTPQRPSEPEVRLWLSDILWNLMQECWRVPATSRPSMAQVSAHVQEIEESTEVPDALDLS
ncbi:Serine/threonine-protein kinase STY46 [Hypsizygus marmoreus]|uniref:Serine/threonine-protein kinase STY46 n=1 Tax=Hypsizygus marmoreus TaxID=39966 RepID=A0A369JM92_HYPMA|nr:Serine/threonine-protein kinase STY46 [Hypsizygus marmoreus]